MAAHYKVIREHTLMYVAKGCLRVNVFRFTFRGPNDRVLYNHWQKVIQELGQAIICIDYEQDCIPQGVANPVIALEDPEELWSITTLLENRYTQPDVMVDVSMMNTRPGMASILWFVGDKVRGANLSTDRRDLYGKSLYASVTEIENDCPAVVHVPMDPVTFEVDNKHLGEQWYTLHEGNGASISVMQEE